MTENDCERLRAGVLREIYDDVVKRLEIEKECFLCNDRLSKATIVYWAELPKIKSQFDVKDKIHKFRIASYTTILLYRRECIQIKDKKTSQTNGLLSLRNDVYAIYAGIQRIPIPFPDKEGQVSEVVLLLRKIPKEPSQKETLSAIEAISAIYKLWHSLYLESDKNIKI